MAFFLNSRFILMPKKCITILTIYFTMLLSPLSPYDLRVERDTTRPGHNLLLSLGLICPTQTISKDELVEVNICLRNPGNISFDALHIWLKYDPASLKVIEIDYDPQDLILKEMELQQTEWKASLTSQLIATNRVDDQNGEIDFRIETRQIPVTVDGIFARFIFKARMSESKTCLHFLFNEWGVQPNTAILYKGEDVLGSTFIHDDGVQHLTLYIKE